MMTFGAAPGRINSYAPGTKSGLIAKAMKPKALPQPKAPKKPKGY